MSVQTTARAIAHPASSRKVDLWSLLAVSIWQSACRKENPPTSELSAACLVCLGSTRWRDGPPSGRIQETPTIATESAKPSRISRRYAHAPSNAAADPLGQRPLQDLRLRVPGAQTHQP